MPICIPAELPTRKILRSENIFVITKKRATRQDIRPLEVAILNLMPTKLTTETQLARLLGNTPLQVNLTLLTTETYRPKHTDQKHLIAFYQTFAQVKQCQFDGLIVTGAPVELLAWRQVEYYQELCQILRWSERNVYSKFFICWGAMAALHYFYGVPKFKLPRKKFGVFTHRLRKKNSMLLRGFDSKFEVPVSRWTEVRAKDLARVSDLEILADAPEAGVYLVRSKKRRQIFAFNHAEYDPETLEWEFARDRKKEPNFPPPVNFQPQQNTWRAHANLLFSNWLNYYVYQATPFELTKIKGDV